MHTCFDSIQIKLVLVRKSMNFSQDTTGQQTYTSIELNIFTLKKEKPYARKQRKIFVPRERIELTTLRKSDALTAELPGNPGCQQEFSLTNCVRLPGEYFFWQSGEVTKPISTVVVSAGFRGGFLPAFDRLIGETNCRLASLAGTRLLDQS